MDVKVIPAEKWKRYIEVSVPAAEVESEFAQALRHYQKRVQIQGFRKGKAPLHFVKQMFGDAIREEAIEKMIPRILTQARDENSLKTVGPADVKEMKYDEQTGLNFRAEVEVAPEIELRRYKGLAFERTIYDIDERDIEETLEILREQKATLKKLADGTEVKAGHIVTVDLQKTDAAGFPIINQKLENQRFIVSGDNEFTRPFLGAKIGETRRTVYTPGPDDPAAEPLPPIFYQATIKEIMENILPALDDAFAKTLGKPQTLEELKEDLRAHLKQRAEQRSREDLHQEIIDELLKVNWFELPEKMAESYAEKFFETIKEQFIGMSEEQLKAEARAAALRRLRWEFLRQRIIAAENIDVSDQEMRDYLVAMALAKKEDPQRLINRTMNDAAKREKLRDDLLEAKTLQFLEGQMQIRERHVPYHDRGQQRIITV
ncbi:MAG: trigger factor [candidate division KSB1 bacterium]|nr:trigger factor [candidate division KSB1 bacterium]MDZ7369290.1 trigger factor [candidate division KSB1 bacterium]MDZ7407324.1 trigger factor [candidate division KSB1 bacterium]